MTVGERIKATRKSQKMTQAQLGKLVGMSQAAVGQFEKSKVTPKDSTIEKFAAALGVSSRFLRGDEFVISSEMYKLISMKNPRAAQIRSDMRKIGRDLITRGDPDAQFPEESLLQEIVDSVIPLDDYEKEEYEHKILGYGVLQLLGKAGLEINWDTLSGEEFGKNFYHHSDIFFMDTETKKLYRIEYDRFAKRVSDLISFTKYTVNQLIAEASDEQEK